MRSDKQQIERCTKEESVLLASRVNRELEQSVIEVCRDMNV